MPFRSCGRRLLCVIVGGGVGGDPSASGATWSRVRTPAMVVTTPGQLPPPHPRTTRGLILGSDGTVLDKYIGSFEGVELDQLLSSIVTT